MTYEDLMEGEGGGTIAQHVLARLLGCSTTKIRAMVEAGQLPKPIKLGYRMRVFETSKVRAALKKLGLGTSDKTTK